MPNHVKREREARLMSRAELARHAGISPVTIDRIEAGMRCRIATKRKILHALGISLAQRGLIFPELI